MVSFSPRYAAEIFPEIAPLLADLNTHLENISWTKSLCFKDGKLVKFKVVICP